MRELEKRGDRVLLVKSGVDDRYSATEVVSHDGERRACVAVPDLRNLLGRPELAAAQVVAVDEAQFFHDLAPFCNFVADSLGKRVIVAGLLGNYRCGRVKLPCAQTCGCFVLCLCVSSNGRRVALVCAGGSLLDTWLRCCR